MTFYDGRLSLDLKLFDELVLVKPHPLIGLAVLLQQVLLDLQSPLLYPL